MNDTVIVYRSQQEKYIDEFLNENPEVIIYSICVVAVIIAVFKLGGWLKKY